jgi:hypothetical protein
VRKGKKDLEGIWYGCLYILVSCRKEVDLLSSYFSIEWFTGFEV